MTTGVYVLELSSGAVKVGGSGDLDQRLAQHVSNAAVYGTEVLRSVVVTNDDWRVAEASAHAAVRAFGAQQVVRETYRGITFDQAVRLVQQYVGDSVVPGFVNDQHYHMLLRILNSAYSYIVKHTGMSGLADHSKIVYNASPEMWFATYELQGQQAYLSQYSTDTADRFVFETNFVANEPVLRSIVSMYGLCPELIPGDSWYGAGVAWRLRFLTPAEYPGLFLPGMV